MTDTSGRTNAAPDKDFSSQDEVSLRKERRDAVSETFQRTQRFAREHGYSLSLDKPLSSRTHYSGQKRSYWDPEKSVISHRSRSPHLRGRPTGNDGRALPRSLRMKSFGDVWKKEIGKRGWAPHVVAAQLVLDWEEVVGLPVAAHSQVTKVESGILTVTCDSEAWATNVRFYQGEILKNIAESFGDGVIEQLHIYGPSRNRRGTGRRYRPHQG